MGSEEEPLSCQGLLKAPHAEGRLKPPATWKVLGEGLKGTKGQGLESCPSTPLLGAPSSPSSATPQEALSSGPLGGVSPCFL